MKENNLQEELVNEKEETSILEGIQETEDIEISESTYKEESELGKVSEIDKSSGDSEEEASQEGSFKVRGASAAGATAVVAVAVMITVLSGSATINKITPYGRSCDYDLTTEIEYVLQDDEMVDYEDFDTNLRLVVFSEDSEETQVEVLSTGNEDIVCEVSEPKENGESTSVKINFKGTVEGLYEETKYKAQVVGEIDGKLKVLAEKGFKTKGLKSEFNSIDWVCKCTIDGNFYYKLNYVDENNYYKDFKYKMIRKETGEVFASGDIVEPQKQQSIDMEGALGIDYLLKIEYVSSAQKDIDSGKTNRAVEIDVKI